MDSLLPTRTITHPRPFDTIRQPHLLEVPVLIPVWHRAFQLPTVRRRLVFLDKADRALTVQNIVTKRFQNRCPCSNRLWCQSRANRRTATSIRLYEMIRPPTLQHLQPRNVLSRSSPSNVSLLLKSARLLLLLPPPRRRSFSRREFLFSTT